MIELQSFAVDRPVAPSSVPSVRPLDDPKRAIAGPRFDALCFWGAPVLALIGVWAYALVVAALPQRMADGAVAELLAASGVLTYAHLIAVVPRAYMNAQVFAAYRRRLIVAPVLLIGALLLSPALLVCATVLAVFWDVHHSAMQTFGLGRIYDMKAGNQPQALRRVDLALNWALYVGPIAAGASLAVHVARFGDFGSVGWDLLTRFPHVVEGWQAVIRWSAVAAWAAIVGYAILHYRRQGGAGYRMPAHKAALLAATSSVSILAWTLSPPFIAFAVVNIFHAVQYFALIWVKEGPAMRARHARALPLFLIGCALFGVAYAAAAAQAKWLIAPFIACSLLHFWYDGFVWSVRRREV